MVLGKFPPGKFPPGKFPPIQLPLDNSPRKIPNHKIRSGLCPPILSIVFLHYFFTWYFVHKWAENVHVHLPRMNNFDMSRTAQCSHFRKNSNNQRKLNVLRQISIMKPTICKYRVLLDCKSTSYELQANTPAVECVPFWANGQASYHVNSFWTCELA